MVKKLLASLEGAWLVDLGGLLAKVEFLGQQLDHSDLDNEVDHCTLDNVLLEETLGVDDEDFTLERGVGVELVGYQLEEVCLCATFIDGGKHWLWIWEVATDKPAYDGTDFLSASRPGARAAAK